MSQIGRYIIKDELGRGGMGRVYRAIDPRFEREVAIKVMPPFMAEEALFRQRFEREAKTIATLQHPGIVPVHDFGEDAGQLYLVMRYMSGGTLRQKLRRGVTSLREVGRIFHNICHALDSAHEQSIVHRDIKPGNVLFDQYGHAFLADFGIARLTNTAVQITATNAIVGTPAYMSPEQVRADIDVDHRTDIYALGIIFYEMLIGHVPYEADTNTKTMLMHITHPLPNILQERPELPRPCQDILEIALAKRREERYDTAVEFSQDIRRVLQNRHTSILTTRPSRPPRSASQPPITHTSDGQLIDEAFITNHTPKHGNDLIDDVLHYYKNPPAVPAPRRAPPQKDPVIEALRPASPQKAAKISPKRPAPVKRATQEAQRKQRDGLIVLGVICFFLLLALAIIFS